MTNKLSELSKPVAWIKADRNIAENWSCTDPEAVISTEGWHSDYNPVYSQEYVSALLGQIEADREIKARLCRESNRLHDGLKAAEKRIAELEAKLATPVQLQNCDFESVAIMAHWCTDEQLEAWVKGVEHAKKQIRASGFKVEGGE